MGRISWKRIEDVYYFGIFKDEKPGSYLGNINQLFGDDHDVGSTDSEWSHSTVSGDESDSDADGSGSDEIMEDGSQTGKIEHENFEHRRDELEEQKKKIECKSYLKIHPVSKEHHSKYSR